MPTLWDLIPEARELAEIHGGVWQATVVAPVSLDDSAVITVKIAFGTSAEKAVHREYKLAVSAQL